MIKVPKPEALSPNTLTLLNLKPLRYLTSLSHFAYFAFAVFVSFFFSVFACFHDNQLAQDQVVELFVEMGCRTQKMDKKVIKKIKMGCRTQKMDKQVIMVFLKEMFLNDSSLHWKNKKK